MSAASSLLGRALPVVKSGLRFGAARLTGRRLPFSITFILTHRCNFQCDYCDIPAAAGVEMTEAQFCAALDELSAAGMARASFSGGEALIRSDATSIIRHARSLGLSTSLNTNGWFTEKKLDELAGSLDMLVLSLDGPEATHDLVRRKRGSYDRVLSVVRAARERGIAVATITVLSNANLGVIEEVLALAEASGFWAYFQPAYNDCFAHGRGLDPALGPAVLEGIARTLSEARSSGLPVGASPGFLERLSRGPSFGDCASCNAGRYFGTVMPDGTVVPCHLVSGEATYPNGLEMGFVRAFEVTPHPTSGPGCAISPYQESDLIFGLDARAIQAALIKLAGPR